MKTKNYGIKERNYYSRNLFYPIVEIDNEYYIVDAFPRFWQLPLGPIRTTFFSYPASKIPLEELEKYRGKNKALPLIEMGIGSLLLGIGVYSSVKISNMKDLVPSVWLAFVLIAGYAAFFMILNYCRKRGGFDKINTYDYQVRFKLQLNKISIKFLLGEVILLGAGYFMNVLLILNLKEKMVCANQIIYAIYLFALYFMFSCPLYNDACGATIISCKKPGN